MYICIYIYIYIYTYTYLYTHAHTHTHTHAFMCLCVHICVCACVYIYMYTHMYSYDALPGVQNSKKFICTHIYFHVNNVYIYTYVHTICWQVCQILFKSQSSAGRGSWRLCWHGRGAWCRYERLHHCQHSRIDQHPRIDFSIYTYIYILLYIHTCI